MLIWKILIIVFRRFSVMCQHLENIAIQISFEVYAARVARKCKLEKFINPSLKIDRTVQTSMSHLVIKVEIELNSFEK